MEEDVSVRIVEVGYVGIPFLVCVCAMVVVALNFVCCSVGDKQPGCQQNLCFDGGGHHKVRYFHSVGR